MPKKLSNVLTPLGVKNAKPGRHADGGGLHLLVKESGARSWVYRFMLNGKSRDLGLGSAGTDGLSLAQARLARDELRLRVKAGVDPLNERKQKAADELAAAEISQLASVTFKDVAKAYIAANESSWRNSKHRQQWTNTLTTYVYPVIGDLPVSDVDTALVLRILEPIWAVKAETAKRVRGRIEAILNTAKVRGYRSGENPAIWRGHLDQILPQRGKSRDHHPALPHERIAEFFADLKARQAMAARALEFTILTVTRSTEVYAATWKEVDLEDGSWVLQADRMKAGRVHRVPLSRRAVEILRETRALGGEYIFPRAKDARLSAMAMTMLIRRMHEASLREGGAGYLDPVMNRRATVHGFRSTFRDWSDECTKYPHEMKQMALSHVISNKAEAAYRRRDMFDKRRQLMEDWADYCSAQIS